MESFPIYQEVIVDQIFINEISTYISLQLDQKSLLIRYQLLY